jgi:Uma2 family endonuclease
MGLPKPVMHLTAEAYLEWESAQPTKNEFLAGEIFAMVGASHPHNRVALRLAARIDAHLGGAPCDVFISDMKIRVEAAHAYFYPDVVVTCDPRDATNLKEKAHPKLIVEILSESTADYDRGEKFAIYRKIPELEEYVLIDPDLQSIDIFRRGPSGEWVLHDARGQKSIRLVSIDLTLDTAEIFAGLPRAGVA